MTETNAPLSGSAVDQSSYYEHTVRWSGETLALMAKWYTGDSSNWTILVKANPGIKPTAIMIGDKVKIPMALVKKTDPMPKTFLKSGNGKQRHSSASKSASPEESKKEPGTVGDEGGAETAGDPAKNDKPDLFGPKE